MQDGGWRAPRACRSVGPRPASGARSTCSSRPVRGGAADWSLARCRAMPEPRAARLSSAGAARRRARARRRRHLLIVGGVDQARTFRMASRRWRTIAPVVDGSRSRAICVRRGCRELACFVGLLVQPAASAARPRRDRDRPTRRRACRARNPASASSAGRGAESCCPSVMKSMLPEYAVPITGLPSRIDSSIVRPKPSDRCGDK